MADYIALARTIYKLDDAKLNALGPQVEKAMQAVIYSLGQEARDLARRLAPKKTGALRASIYVSRPGQEPAVQGTTTIVPRKSTVGYFRAINAAVRANPRRLSLLGGIEEETGITFHEHTQRVTSRGTITAGKVSNIASRAVFSTQSYEGFQQSVQPFQGGGRNTFFVSVGAAVYYAAMVEYGSPGRGIPPKPFLTPAIEWARGQLPARVKSAFNNIPK